MTKDEKNVLCDALIKIIDLSVMECDSDYNSRLSEILKPMEKELGIDDDMDARITKSVLDPLKLLSMALTCVFKEKEKRKDD